MSRPIPTAIACFNDLGIAVIQPLAQADSGGENKQDAGDGHAPERHLPRHGHTENHRVRKEEVVAHRRGHGDRIVGEPGHQERGDGA